MKVLKYRLRCTTDNVWEEVWVPDGDPVPTQCPTNTDHTIDTVLTSITGFSGGGPPVDEDGTPIQAPAFENTGGLHPLWHGHLYDVTAGATNIFDELVTVEKRLRGGWYTLMDGNAAVGDYIEESVVDKDDVLGLFSTYGYTVGVDVLELKKYVLTEYVHPKSEGMRQEFQANSVFSVVAGLYTRTLYESTGTVDLKLAVTPFGYQ